MTLRNSLMVAAAGAALVFAMPAAADTWGADRNEPVVRVSPDLADRAEAARQADLARILDARERSQVTRVATTAAVPEPAHDDHVRLDRSSIPQPVTSPVSGSDLAWQQIGLGFAGGVVVVLALLLVLRVPTDRVTAH